MACRVETMWCTLLTAIFIVLSKKTHVRSESQVPCYFIFGDSLVDPGNNNVQATSFKANYSPYGIDFPGVTPTGRFTNRRTIADIIAEFLGFEKYIPPFATAKGPEIIRGVNYASGGSGIRNETGRINLGDVISLDRQLRNHQITISRIAAMLGSKISAQKHLSKCLYHVITGNNDYINNYFMPELYQTSHLYSPAEYARVLTHQYSQQLRTLYNLGARKVAVFGLSQIGSGPALKSNEDNINNAVTLFNERLKPLVDDLNNNLTDAKFILLNQTSILAGDLSTVGIRVSDAPCCKIALPVGVCVPGQVPCSNRTEYYFYDGLHPSETVNIVSASRAYRAQSPTDAYPINIIRLVQLSCVPEKRIL